MVYKCIKVVILGEVIKKSIERTLEPRAGILTLRSCGDSKVPAKKPGKEVQDRQEETEGRAASQKPKWKWNPEKRWALKVKICRVKRSKPNWARPYPKRAGV